MRPWLDSLRSAVADLRKRSPGTLILVVACALIVAIGPLAMTLSRKEYEASSSIAQRVDLPGYTPAQELAGVKLIMGALINSPSVRRTLANEVAWTGSAEQVAMRLELGARRRAGYPEAVITARASTVDDARELAAATARTLRERAERVVRRQEAYQSVLRGGARAYGSPTPARAGGERPVDAALAALPGRLPPNPDPVWAAVAGLALAAALLLAVVALGPWERKGRSDAAV